MISDATSTPWQSMVRHAPGFIVGLYFISLHFVGIINLSFLILLAGGIFLLLAHPAPAWRRLASVPTALASALFASTVLSIVMAPTGNRLIVDMGVSQLPGLLVYLIVVLCIHSPRQLAGIVIGFCVALPIALWLFFNASLQSEFSRAVQLIYHASQPLFLAANDMLMYVVFMPLVVWFALHEWRGWIGRTVAGAYVAALAGLAVLMLSRLSMLLVAAYGFLRFTRGRRLYLWGGAIATAGLAIAAIALDASLAEKLQRLDLARLRTWIAALAMFVDAPWFGNGVGSFATLYPEYLQSMPESIRFGREIRDIGWAHSLFFESAAEKGIVGLVVTIAYFVYLFAALRARSRFDDSGLIAALRATALIGLVAAVFELSLLRVWGIFAIYLLLALVAVFTARDTAAGR